MHAQRTIMYKFLVDIFFEKLKELEPIISVQIGVILIRTLHNYGKRCGSTKR
jgi:hypothetical protein